MSYTSGFVHLDGGDIHYLRWEGDGPPILIWHGNSHCAGVFAPLGEALSKRFSVIAVDLRGHGLSSKTGEFSWREFRDDAVGLVEALDLRDILIASHSRGGGVGLLAAAAMPERVAGAIIYEPNVATRAMPGRGSRAPETPPRERRTTFASREEMYQHYRNRGAFKDWREDYFLAYIEHGGIEREDGSIELACLPDVQAAMVSLTRDASEWKPIADCKVPVRAVFGERSGWLAGGGDPVAEIKAMFTACDMRVMPDATHSGPMEHPELWEKVVLDFEAEVRGR